MTTDVAWRFGQVYGMDYEPQLRVVLLARLRITGAPTGVWAALVLCDNNPAAGGWPVGKVVTITAQMAGIRAYGHVDYVDL